MWNWSSSAGRERQLLLLRLYTTQQLQFLRREINPQQRDVQVSLKACAHLPPHNANSLHASLIKQGLHSLTSIANSILSFYFKTGDLSSATKVFYGLDGRDSISWNIWVHGFLHLGLFERGLWWFSVARSSHGFQPNVSTLVLLTQACAELGATQEGKKLHGYLIKNGFLSISSIVNSLLRYYLHDDHPNCCARKLFDEMRVRDVISWSMMIGWLVKRGEADVALEIFNQMISTHGIEPDGVVFVGILSACAKLEDMYAGRMVHGSLIHRGLGCDLFVENSLIDMYSRCGDATSGFKIFSDMSVRNIVSWNSMLSGYIQNGHTLEALSLIGLMVKDGIEVDKVTLVNFLQISKHLAHPSWSKSVHCFIIRRAFESNELVLNSLVDAYASCNLVRLAWQVFVRMRAKDVVSWSTMIAGFAHCGKPDKAIAIFEEMNERKVVPNAITIINVLEACVVLADLKCSKWAHGIAMRRGFALDVEVGTTIIDMYAKCGEMEAARKAFHQIPLKNMVTWSALIAGCAANGLPQEALALLAEMEHLGQKPNSVTILSVFAACNHGGLIDDGLSLFRHMVENSEVELGPEHYSCVVDMLGRAGMLDIAVDLIEKMPCSTMKGNVSMWGALLSACRNFMDTKLGEEAMSNVLALEPLNSAGYLMASSMYASHGLWADVARTRMLVKERGVKVPAGYSFVQHGNKLQRFVAGDRSHQEVDETDNMVKRLHMYMRLDHSEDVMANLTA